MALKKSQLYSSLWQSCDELRGGMDASQYKDYVLFMLFIKYISDKYADSEDFAPPVTIPKGASFKDMVKLKGMRHLINTYIQADPADPLGSVDNYSLVELIIETGIHDAIAKKLNEKGKLSKNAVAEGIINNVRKTIIRDQLTDPKFYEEMSKLLDDLIRQKRDDTKSYEQFLKKAEELVQRMAGNTSKGTHPPVLNGHPEAIRLFNNLASIEASSFQCPTDEDVKASLALDIDRAMREKAPAGWKGDDTREKQVLNALFPLMERDRTATMAVFEIIKSQSGYA